MRFSCAKKECKPGSLPGQLGALFGAPDQELRRALALPQGRCRKVYSRVAVGGRAIDERIHGSSSMPFQQFSMRVLH